MDENLGLIKDEELDKLFDVDRAAEKKIQQEKEFDAKLEEELAATDVGANILALQKMGIQISIEQIAAKYVEKNGRELDLTGNININFESIDAIYVTQLENIGIEIGRDLTDFKVRTAGNLDNIRTIEEKEQEKSKTMMNQLDEFLNKISNDKNENVFLTKSQLDDIIKIMSGNDADRYNKLKECAEREDKNKVENNIETIDDATMLEYIYNIAFLNEIDITGFFDKEEDANKYKEQMLNQIKMIAEKSKFKDRILDENGEITEESVLRFKDDFETRKNSEDLLNKISKYLKYDISEIGMIEREKLITVFLRAERSDNMLTRQLAVKLATKLGFNVVEQDALSKKLIESLAKQYFGKDCNIEDIIQNSELNTTTFGRKMEQIKETIRRTGICLGKTGDEIDKYRSEGIRTKKVLCSKKEEVIYSVLHSINAGNTKKNDFSKDAYVKQVVALYCKFREEEIAANNKKFNGISRKSFNNEGEGTNSYIIRKFMKENSQYFGDYLQNIDKVNSQASVDMLIEKGMSNVEFSQYLIAYKQISRKTQRIQKDEKTDSENIKAMKEKIAKIYEQRNAGESVDETLKGEIFELAKNVSVDSLSTEMLTRLEGLDSENFKNIFKDNPFRKIGQNTKKSVYYATDRLFSYVPALLQTALKKGTRENFLPKLSETVLNARNKMKANQKGNDKENENVSEVSDSNVKRNGIKNLFSKIFGRKNQNLLPAADLTTEQQKEQKNVESVAKKDEEKKDYIAETYGATVSEKDAINKGKAQKEQESLIQNQSLIEESEMGD